VEDLDHELYQLKRLLERSKSGCDRFDISDMLGLARFLEPYKLLCIALLLPVTSAACEVFHVVGGLSEDHNV